MSFKLTVVPTKKRPPPLDTRDHIPPPPPSPSVDKAPSPQQPATQPPQPPASTPARLPKPPARVRQAHSGEHIYDAFISPQASTDDLPVYEQSEQEKEQEEFSFANKLRGHSHFFKVAVQQTQKESQLVKGMYTFLEEYAVVVKEHASAVSRVVSKHTAVLTQLHQQHAATVISTAQDGAKAQVSQQATSMGATWDAALLALRQLQNMSHAYRSFTDELTHLVEEPKLEASIFGESQVTECLATEEVGQRRIANALRTLEKSQKGCSNSLNAAFPEALRKKKKELNRALARYATEDASALWHELRAMYAKHPGRVKAKVRKELAEYAQAIENANHWQQSHYIDQRLSLGHMQSLVEMNLGTVREQLTTFVDSLDSLNTKMQGCALELRERMKTIHPKADAVAFVKECVKLQGEPPLLVPIKYGLNVSLRDLDNLEKKDLQAAGFTETWESRLSRHRPLTPLSSSSFSPPSSPSSLSLPGTDGDVPLSKLPRHEMVNILSSLPTPSLEVVFRNPVCVQALQRHMARNLCGENMDFYLDVQAYKDAFTHAELPPSLARTQAQRIFMRYIDTQSPQCVNLGSQVSLQAAVSLQPHFTFCLPHPAHHPSLRALPRVPSGCPLATVFDTAVDEIVHLMATDSLPKFLKSVEYAEFLELANNAPVPPSTPSRSSSYNSKSASVSASASASASTSSVPQSPLSRSAHER